MLDRRRSGVLLHPTALPSPWGIGDIGPSARDFVDFLAAAGQSVWQVLPLGPTGYGDSPYSAFSAFAGNPLLISPELLVAAGDLDPAEAVPPVGLDAAQVDYGLAGARKGELLRRAATRFAATPGGERHDRFAAFCAGEAGWLEDYALFRALRRHCGERHWTRWPVPLRDRDPDVLAAARRDLADELRLERYTQFVFAEQWQALRQHARSCGVLLFGDIPIFVSDDSADVWAHRGIFRLDREGRPLRVAGVPPDYFSATGQRWGNPLYDWSVLQGRGFDWWIERLRRNLALCDLVRIDHFRGFSACWSIAADQPTAVHGCWEEVPGRALFATAAGALGGLPVVAEDLGVITPDVEALRAECGFPGMKILQFAFGGAADNPYLPHNYTRNCVVYTGTHDNDTTAGWWDSLSPEERGSVADYCGDRGGGPCRGAVAAGGRERGRPLYLPGPGPAAPRLGGAFQPPRCSVGELALATGVPRPLARNAG